MTDPIAMCEVWRGPFLESVHTGHAIVCNARGEIIEAWGDPDKIVLPRSSIKMIQALPLIESGAADAVGLKEEHLALSCASHNGAAIHTERVARWLETLGLSDDDLRCGPQMPADREAAKKLICSDANPCQIHNNCSGKHAGFLTSTLHQKAGPEYHLPDHPIQTAVLDAFENVTQETSAGYGIDGCSAPNFAASLRGLATAMAFFASARPDGDARERAAIRLRQAMVAHPELVAGEGRACTKLMRAMNNETVVKTGAEGVFTAIVPSSGLGVVLKITDGATRASESAMAAILVKLGALAADHPVISDLMVVPQKSRRGLDTGWLRPAAALTAS